MTKKNKILSEDEYNAKMDALNESIEATINSDEEENEITDKNSLPDAIKEIRKTLFLLNQTKMGKISGENAKGMTQMVILNNFVERNYGVRFKSLDDIIVDTMSRRLSVEGFGIASFVSALQTIAASFVSSADSIGKKILGR